MPTYVKIALCIMAGLIAACLGFTSASCVPAGHVGVVKTFGQVDNVVLGEGLNFLAPWKTVTKMSYQTKENKEEASCPTKEGLSVQLEASLLYSLSKDRAADVYRTVGEEYENVLVTSQFRSALRSATVHYKAEDLYTANREKLEVELMEDVKQILAPRGINCEAVLLRNVQLPQTVKERIEAKMAADQDAQRMEFVLLKEKQEAERKRLEATGIADAQLIIKKDLDDNYLKYLWIEALKVSAEHKNATIYVPTGQDGMPFFKPLKDKE